MRRIPRALACIKEFKNGSIGSASRKGIFDWWRISESGRARSAIDGWLWP